MFGNKKIRLRFAPSPTGFLHIGNLRTALFGYLLAKKLKGEFILRIEDTDQKRETEGAVKSLLDIMSWTGVEFDEGADIGGKYGPYIQSKRLKTYKKLSDKLIKEGKAYPCFCSEDDLKNMRAEQEAKKLPPRYNRTCRDLDKTEVDKKTKEGKSFVIRQKMPLDGEIKVYDELRGEIKFRASDLDDHVLIKSNGVPTYQFANIVDDHLMKISHVTRGEEWIPSFPKNVLLYQAFKWKTPKFIHLPLILNKEGGKLSKRQGDVFVEDYRTKGYLPEAIVNFCSLLGWHDKGDNEIHDLEALEDIFDLKGMGSSSAIFDLEKLDYFNGYYIRQKSIEELTELCLPYLEKANHKLEDEDRMSRYISLAQERMKKLEDVVEMTNFLFTLPNYEVELLKWKELSLEQVKGNLEKTKTKLEEINEWEVENLEKTIIGWIKEEGGKNGDYLWPLRVSLSGLKNSPSPFEIAWALGKEDSLERIDKALEVL